MKSFRGKDGQYDDPGYDVDILCSPTPCAHPPRPTGGTGGVTRESPEGPVKGRGERSRLPRCSRTMRLVTGPGLGVRMISEQNGGEDDVSRRVYRTLRRGVRYDPCPPSLRRFWRSRQDEGASGPECLAPAWTSVLRPATRTVGRPESSTSHTRTSDLRFSNLCHLGLEPVSLSRRRDWGSDDPSRCGSGWSAPSSLGCRDTDPEMY